MDWHPRNSDMSTVVQVRKLGGTEATSPAPTVHTYVMTILRDDTQGRQKEAAVSTPQILHPFSEQGRAAAPVFFMVAAPFPMKTLYAFGAQADLTYKHGDWHPWSIHHRLLGELGLMADCVVVLNFSLCI